MGVMRRALAIAVMVGVTATAQSPRLHLPPLDAVLPMRAETIYGAVRAHVDPKVAMNVIDVMAPSWRLAGNPSYDWSIDMIGKW